MSALQRFGFEGTEVRVVIGEDGEPWFVARDVLATLGYAKPRDALARLSTEQRGSTVLDTLGGPQSAATVNLDGLNDLILDSRKPAARAMRRWVTRDVLPAIQKTGRYEASASAEERFALAVIDAQALIAKRDARIAELEPKAEAFTAFLDSKGTHLIGTVARILGVGSGTFFRWLYEEGVLIKGGPRHGQPYAQYGDWFEVKGHNPERTNGHAVTTTRFTPAGAEACRRLLIRRGRLTAGTELVAQRDEAVA